MNQAAGILARWGRVGSDLQSFQSEVDWQPAQLMVDAMQTWGDVQKGNYRDILDKSAACLAQFGEPLRVDFGTHRWLKNNREESYSAWLAWIIEQLESPGEVFGLFKLEGKDKNAAISDCVGIRPHVVCEKSIKVPSGEGRLDIVIEYKKTESEKVALIVIEVKLVSTDAADLQKQAGYRVWMDQQIAYDENRRFPVLLTTEGEEGAEYPGGFRFVSWARVCVELRRIAPRYISGRPIVAALILSFVSAVERNLLDMSLPAPEASAMTWMAHSRVLDHIEESLQGELQ
jgi:hypothetical protein